MAKFRVNRDFAMQRGGEQYGPWTSGEEVEIEEPVVVYINWKYGNVLSAVREQPPTPNRQVMRSPKTR